MMLCAAVYNVDDVRDTGNSYKQPGLFVSLGGDRELYVQIADPLHPDVWKTYKLIYQEKRNSTSQPFGLPNINPEEGFDGFLFEEVDKNKHNAEKEIWAVLPGNSYNPGDWASLGSIILSHKSGQAEEARKFAEEIRTRVGNRELNVAGHSKGIWNALEIATLFDNSHTILVDGFQPNAALEAAQQSGQHNIDSDAILSVESSGSVKYALSHQPKFGKVAQVEVHGDPKTKHNPYAMAQALKGDLIKAQRSADGAAVQHHPPYTQAVHG
jgi:hypothetical protein